MYFIFLFKNKQLINDVFFLTQCAGCEPDFAILSRNNINLTNKSDLCNLILNIGVVMGRNNEKNIKKHNDKLHKAQDKAKQALILRKEKLKIITKKFNEDKSSES